MLKPDVCNVEKIAERLQYFFFFYLIEKTKNRGFQNHCDTIYIFSIVISVIYM